MMLTDEFWGELRADELEILRMSSGIAWDVVADRDPSKYHDRDRRESLATRRHLTNEIHTAANEATPNEAGAGFCSGSLCGISVMERRILKWAVDETIKLLKASTDSVARRLYAVAKKMVRVLDQPIAAFELQPAAVAV